jgi:hypothetical protein
MFRRHPRSSTDSEGQLSADPRCHRRDRRFCLRAAGLRGCARLVSRQLHADDLLAATLQRMDAHGVRHASFRPSHRRSMRCSRDRPCRRVLPHGRSKPLLGASLPVWHTVEDAGPHAGPDRDRHLNGSGDFSLPSRTRSSPRSMGCRTSPPRLWARMAAAASR